MENEKPKIEIIDPIKASNEKPKIDLFDPIGNINDKFDFYIKLVVGVLFVAILTMLFMVATLVLDSLHFNSATYKEYSQKTEVIKTLEDTNKQQLEQNKENQQTIIEQQKQIIELLKKKQLNEIQIIQTKIIK